MPERVHRDEIAKEEILYKPFTLKRLTDYDPSVKSEGSWSLITGKQLKEDIFENVDMLFNSRSHASFADLGGHEEVEESVLAYGISDFCGRQSSTASRDDLRLHIFKQLRLFEPRLDPASLTVEFQDTEKGDSTSVEYRINGIIRAKGVDEEIAFISRLNLESGNAELRLDGQ
jgi:predicted component of type VI protein secretion system